MPHPKLCVVGSSNLDMNSYVTRFPAPGETIHGQRFTTGYGGKGANQAVMAARLGALVTFVGKVGEDIFGRDMRANLHNEGIDDVLMLHLRDPQTVCDELIRRANEAGGMDNISVIVVRAQP